MNDESLSKQARSDAQRLESLKQKKELEKKRRAVIANSLRGVDTPSSKKIVFDDSDEDLQVAPSSSLSSAAPPSKKAKLFDDDSGDEEDEVLLPDRLAGKKGEKLMHLETKFNDKRFKLDDKFASSESEQEEEIDELVEEKNKNRELLAKVLGKNISAPKKTKIETNKAPPRPFTRFDPENEEHVQWMKMYGGQENKECGKADMSSSSSSSEDEGNENEQENKETVHAVVNHFYEMDDAFAEELKNKIAGTDVDSSNGFSFLAMIGRKDVEMPTCDHDAAVEEDIRPNKKMLKILGQDDEDLEEDSQHATLNGTNMQSTSLSTFFLTGTEPQVKSVLANFRMTQSLEKTVGLWTTYRDSIMKIYRHHRKDARKRQRNTKDFHKFKKNNKDSVKDKSQDILS